MISIVLNHLLHAYILLTTNVLQKFCWIVVFPNMKKVTRCPWRTWQWFSVQRFYDRRRKTRNKQPLNHCFVLVQTRQPYRTQFFFTFLSWRLRITTSPQKWGSKRKILRHIRVPIIFHKLWMLWFVFKDWLTSAEHVSRYYWHWHREILFFLSEIVLTVIIFNWNLVWNEILGNVNLLSMVTHFICVSRVFTIMNNVFKLILCD